MCAVLNISPRTYYKYRSKEDHDYYDYLIIKDSFARFLLDGTQQKSETLRPHRVRTSRQKLWIKLNKECLLDM